jgi:hypothetical protein
MARPLIEPLRDPIVFDGIVRLTSVAEKGAPGGIRGLRCGNRISPLIRRLGSEDPERRARDEMALKVEG